MALAAGFAALPARAQPSGAQVIHGAATFTQQGANLTVTTQNGAGTGHSAINWQSFNVPKGSTTHFAQPNAASTSINRVVAPNPSSILGTLSSNGHLVLVNPSGIAVGAGAVVDTARFTASTLRMSDADATAGRLRFEGGQGAQLRVDGQVVARQGDVVLIGQNVEAGQKAIIESPNGATVLAAGQKVHVTGRGLEGIHFEVQAPGDKAVNLGTLKGDAVGIFAGTLKHSGLVQARAVTTAGGRVVLKAADMAEVSGTVTAQGAGGAGGSVDVLGARVGVLAGATIDTSNSAGGGQIRVGGDYKGQNAEVPNAQVTYVDAGATLRANATERGDGGRVIVWADDTARVHGTVEARGGPQGGNGGFIETSGKRVLSVEGVRASAAAGSGGKAGTWLLDPANITIQVNGPSTALHSEPWFMPSATEESVLTAATLNAALAGGDGTVVLITTDTGNTRPGNGDIVFDGRLEAGGPILLRRGTAGTATLLLQAAGDVVFRGSTTIEAGEETPTPTPAPRRLYVMLNPGLRSAEARVRSEAGSTLALQASHADHDVELFVGRGATWTNEGTVTLNANGRITLADTNSYVGATLNNLAGGVINGAAGARGGIVGFDDGFGGRGWGSLHNAGTIQLSQGSVEVAGFTQTGGSTGLVDGANFRARTQFHVAGAFVFDGGNFIVSQSSGDLVVPASASITAAGSASFIARQGDLLVQGPITAATDLTLVADPGDSSGGVIQIQAPLTAGRSLALIANGWSSTLNASIVQGAAGAIHADELLVRSYGQARLTHEGNVVHSVAASAFEFELVNNADVLRVRSLEHDGIGGRGAFAGGILTMAGARIDNRSGGGLPQGLAPGSIVVDSYIDAGSVDLTAAGDIVASHIKTYGGNPSAGEGNVRLQAAGRVEFGSIHTFVEDWAAGGGYSGGSVHVSAGTSISGGEVVTDALAGEAPAQRAGDVLLSAGNGSVSLEGHISARGGAANVSLGATGGGVLVTGSIDASGGSLGGGAGGVVIVTATEGIAIGSIQADGAGGSLAAGGAGGAITLSSGGGGVTVHQGLSARGGDSEGGMGGAGGRIVIASTAAGGLHLQGTHLVAAGGDGAAWSSANRGPGGSIRVSAAGTLSLNGTSLDARAGSAGPIAGTHAGAGLVELQAPSIVLDGTNHLGGNAHVRADGATAGSGVVSVQPGQLQWSDGNWLHVQGQQGVVLAGSIDAGAKAAALPGTTLGLYAVTGDIVQAGGTLDVPRLHVAADAGQVLLEQVNAVDAVAGTAGGDIRLRNGGPLLVGSVATPHGAATGLHAGGAIDLRTSGDLVVASAVETHGGSLTLVAGDAALGGSGRLLVNAGLDTTGGGATPLGAAILLRSGSLVGDGPSVSITGSGNRVAVNAGAGLLQVEGAGHVQVAQADLSGGAIELRPFESRLGVLALDGATLTATAPTGTISADFAGGVFVFDSTVATVGGGIHLGSDLGAVVVTSSSLVSAGGPLRLQGGASAAPVDNFGVSLWDASLDAGAGTIHVSGRSADPFTDGVLLVGQVHLAAAGGTLVEGQHLSAEPLAEGGLGVRVGDPGRAAILTGHGALTLRGSSAAPAHAGIALQDAHVDRNGSVSIEGSSATGPIGVRIADSTIHTQGHHQQVTSTSGVSIHASTLATSGGNLMVAGGNADYVAPVGSAAVDITGGSSLHAGTGNVTIAATTVEGTAFSFVTDAPGGGLTISGADVVITGNTTGGTALKIDNETITATHSLTLTAVDGGLEITAGSQVVNTGTGPMVLQAQSSHPGAPAFLRVAAGATVNSAGPIRLSADTLELLAPVVSATGQIQVVPLDLSRPITIGDGAIAGTLNFSQSALDLLVGDTVLIGGDTFTGGIRVLSSVTIGNRLLSLVNLGDVAQDVGARLTVGSLFVDARSVNLHDVLIADGGSLAGRAHGGAFGVR
ncbi:MAG TPA: filamentous hemagglutinin N-terminal domain-containing protein, partial [Ramlibacter sp.]|nr:filamentous hemagglutinin N-terminal domain-containing protein [Ramlibacter sp.]